MAKKVEEIVRGAGMFQALITLLIEKVKEFGGSIEDIYRLVTPEGSELLSQIVKIIVEAGNKVLSLGEMIAQGKYDWVNSGITAENFPVDPAARWDEETRLFHFDKDMSIGAVKAEMAKEGWKPASIWHLLFFGMEYPELQRQFPIIALGSVWRGRVPCLLGSAGRRVLDLSWLDFDWPGFCRFLAVRK